MRHKAVKSSWVRSIGYEQAGGILEIETTANKTSIHKNVPRQVYESFLASPSKGQFFHDHIRDQYPGEAK